MKTNYFQLTQMTKSYISLIEAKLVAALLCPMLNLYIPHSQNSLHYHLQHQNQSKEKAHSSSK